MRTGPDGQKRPGDVIANAVHVAKIATGEAIETYAKRAQPKAEKKILHSDVKRNRAEGQPAAGNRVAVE